MLENNLGNRLREKRKQDRLTLDQLASKLHISRDYVSKIEIGKQPEDKISEIVRESIENYLSSTKPAFVVTKELIPLRSDQEKLLQIWEKLDCQKRGALLTIMESMEG